MPFHLISEDIILSLRIVCLAVIPNELNVIEGFLDSTILSGFEFILNFEEVHRMFDDKGVVIEF